MSWLPRGSIYSSLDADLSSLDEEAALASQGSPFSSEPLESQQLRASAQRRSSRSLLGILNPSGRHYHHLGGQDVVEEDEEGAEDDQGPPKSFMFESKGQVDAAIDSTPRRAAPAPASPPDRSATASPSGSPPASLTHGSPVAPLTPRRSGSPVPGLRLGTGAYQEGRGRPKPGEGLSRRDRALWRWVNVEDLDVFLMEVYAYYIGKGVWCIGLSRLLNLLTVGFVIAFSIFLGGCIDYSILKQRDSLAEVLVPSCVSTGHGWTLFMFLIFGGFWVWRAFQFSKSMNRLWEMRAFFEELLEVPDADIQSVPWHVIVGRLTALRASHPSALSGNFSGDARRPRERLDAHDVANRIMREENYLIALFNRDILDLSAALPGPLSGRRVGGQLTRLLEWNIRFCLLGFLFSPNGQVRRVFTSERNRAELIEALHRRFVLMGCINTVLAPFVLVYLVLYSFFRYFEEYRNTPASIGSRQFTRLARWKFREFNELPHVFAARLRQAQTPAMAYVNQFPREKTVLIARFVAFVTGSFAAVLLILTVVDPEAFLHFQVTKERTVIFYLGVCTAVLAIARGMSPDMHAASGAPEALMNAVTEHTHYLPPDWRGRLHSAEVNVAFGQLFQLRIVTFAHELLSVVVAPFVLAQTLPHCAPRLIDFFREFTVHVDGLGYVCSFAEFKFHRAGEAPTTDGAAPAPAAATDSDKDATAMPPSKMERSVLNFAQAHPGWQPDEGTSVVMSTTLARAREYERAFQRASMAGRRRQASVPSRLRQPSSGGSPARRQPALISDEAGLGASYVEPLSVEDHPPASPTREPQQSLLGILTQAQKGW